MLNNFKEKLTIISKDGLPITISSSTIEKLIRLKLDKQDVKVEITSGYLILSGTAEVKKMMFMKNVSFRLKLKPVQLDKRTIQFEIVEMKPVNIDYISSKIFNRPPFLVYTNQTIRMDLNELDVVKRIPVGNVKSFEIVEEAIIIKLSL